MIPYCKAHACGNDFLIVEARHAGSESHFLQAQRLCARNTGVGADGVEYFEWTAALAGRIRLYNADGSIAEISGNGTRCVAAWMAYQKEAVPGETLTIETDAGVRECRIVTADGHSFAISSGMGIPKIHEHTVTLKDGARVAGAVVSTGNPHFVIFADDAEFRVQGRSWYAVGEEICQHRDFPAQTNVEFVRVLSPGEIEIRIFERGVGPTTSSGTGTCATATAAITLQGATSPLRVLAPGGAQQVEWKGEGTELKLSGPAEIIGFGEAF